MDDLVVIGACGSDRFLAHLADQEHAWQVTIDLRRMTFCEPLGLVGMAAFAEHALREGARVVLHGPDNSDVANYLARMRVGSTLAALGVEHDLPIVREHDVGSSLFELTPFDGARGAGALAAVLHDAVAPTDERAAEALYEGLCEAGQNVAHHSGIKRGFIAAQRLQQRTRLYFAVGDSGRGILGTLRRRGAKDDLDALHLALKRGKTGTSDRGRGVGLPDVLDHVSALQGALHVVSGTASMTARFDQREGSTAAKGLRGTLVQGYVATTPPQD